MTTAVQAAARARFVDDAIATASPARLVTMLYDRLVLDLTRGAAAQRAGDRDGAHTALLHAQDIVAELASSLRVGSWPGAEALASLYGFLHSELVRANLSGDPARTDAVGDLIAPLAEAWRIAAVEVTAQAGLAAAVERAS
ncbi:MAG: flagellar export chaperone FliS [Sporichthyaceae bacterium]